MDGARQRGLWRIELERDYEKITLCYTGGYLDMPWASLLIFAPNNRQVAIFQDTLEVLIHGKSDRLPRRHPHDPGRDALVKSMEAFLLEHIAADDRDPPPGRRLPPFRGRLLQPRLDRVDGRVAQGPHGAADEPDDGRLPRRDLPVPVRGLEILEPLFQLGVGGEIDRLVRALAEGRERHPAVQRPGAFFLEHGVGGVRRVAVFGDVERVGHAVVLGLQADLDDFHRGDDADGFGDAGGEAGEKGALAGDLPRGGVGEELLVPFVRGEADGHFRHDAGDDGAEAFV